MSTVSPDSECYFRGCRVLVAARPFLTVGRQILLGCHLPFASFDRTSLAWPMGLSAALFCGERDCRTGMPRRCSFRCCGRHRSLLQGVRRYSEFWPLGRPTTFVSKAENYSEYRQLIFRRLAANPPNAWGTAPSWLKLELSSTTT